MTRSILAATCLVAALGLAACNYNEEYNNQAYNAEGADYAGNADYNATADYNAVNAANAADNAANTTANAMNATNNMVANNSY
jgi:hypothetical protein